jgi:hypothetical protein
MSAEGAEDAENVMSAEDAENDRPVSEPRSPPGRPAAARDAMR